MYNTLVAPVMDYACELWGSFKYDGFNTIQHRAMRTYLGVGMCAPLPAIYGDMAWVTPQSRHEVAALRYWFRLTRLPRSRMTRRIFDWDYEFANAGLRSWNLDIKGFIDKCGIGDVFTRTNWGQQSTEVNVRHVVTQLNQLDQGQRRQVGSTMSRLREYNGLILNTNIDLLRPADYVTAMHSRKRRSILAKVRTGTISLAIENGRYTQTPEENRLCISCDQKSIENIEHVLLNCPKYNDIRSDILPLCLRTPHDYIECLKSMFSSYKDTKELAVFISKAMDLRVKWLAIIIMWIYMLSSHHDTIELILLPRQFFRININSCNHWISTDLVSLRQESSDWYTMDI